MKISRGVALAFFSGSLGLAGNAGAGYGMNVPAIDAQSAGMGGADLSIVDNTAALTVNPAGLSHIQGSHVDMMFEPGYWFSEHHDSLNGTRKVSDRYIAIFSGGYARRLNESWVVGVGAYVQGGAGFVYKNLENIYGTRDEQSTLFGAYKLSPGFSWQVNDQLSVGASAGLVYSNARQKYLPETSTAEFSGFRIDDVAGFSHAYRVGLLYELSPRWTLAAGYGSEVPVKLTNGRIKFNRSHDGLEPLIYEDVSIKGLNFAEEWNLGASFKPGKRWLIATDISQVNWSKAMSAYRLIATQPNDANAPATLPLPPAPLNWRDQTVVTLGVAYQYRPRTTLRAGAGYGRNPQSTVSLTPDFNLVPEYTLAGGFSQEFDRGWIFDFGAIYQPVQTVKYNNPIYGGPSSEGFGALALHFSLSKDW